MHSNAIRACHSNETKKKLFNSTKNVYFFEISRQEENLLVLKIQNVKRNCQLEDMTIIC